MGSNDPDIFYLGYIINIILKFKCTQIHNFLTFCLQKFDFELIWFCYIQNATILGCKIKKIALHFCLSVNNFFAVNLNYQFKMKLRSLTL